MPWTQDCLTTGAGTSVVKASCLGRFVYQGHSDRATKCINLAQRKLLGLIDFQVQQGKSGQLWGRSPQAVWKGDDKFWTLYKYWKDCKPEEELYIRLKDNPFWPFKQIGEGYFYVVFRSDRVEYGIWLLFFTVFMCAFVVLILGPFGVALGFFLLLLIFGYWAIHGKLSWRELIISRRGRGKYMIRMFQNEEILYQSELRNVYIRIIRKYDANGDSYFCLMLGGYEIDDHRITRMTKAEGPLRIMGMRIAYRIGINFFDWKDESEEHFIWHYRTHSNLKYVTHAEATYKKMSMGEELSPEGSFLAVPGLNRGTLKNSKDGLLAPPGAEEDDATDDDSNQKRKVRINKVVNVRTMK